MKTEWICRWQFIPGGKEQVEAYPTRHAARKAMAKVLREAVDLTGYIDSLRKGAEADCASSAGFLERFLDDFTIPESEAEIPPHLEIPDHCLLEIHPYEGFRWGYMRGECPLLMVSNVYYGDGNEPLLVDFGFENPAVLSPDRVNGVRIQITERKIYGTSAYPLLILRVLSDTPKTQKEILRAVWETYETRIERKAAGRHLELLMELGFPVHKCKEGYYITG